MQTLFHFVDFVKLSVQLGNFLAPLYLHTYQSGDVKSNTPFYFFDTLALFIVTDL